MHPALSMSNALLHAALFAPPPVYSMVHPQELPRPTVVPALLHVQPCMVGMKEL